eukprot:GSChrysophyteH2.ASY1.ANO1.1420.1 assembled CDS
MTCTKQRCSWHHSYGKSIRRWTRTRKGYVYMYIYEHVCLSPTLLHSLTPSPPKLQVHEKFSHLNSDMVTEQSNSTHTIDYLQIKVSAQDDQIDKMSKTLHKLTNRTTNADVLEKLDETQKQLRIEMASTADSVSTTLTENHRLVEKELEDSRNSVRSAINDNRKILEKQLDDNKKNIENTKSDVYTQMDTTVSKIDVMVAEATRDVSSMQHNVTSKMNHWNHVLDSTVTRLNDDIKTAESKIHKDVSLLQANVDTYVEVTNKQFAQEDDFVKYQLAGTFTLLGCLISMWHLTSHLRHYDKPEVQRRIMAVLWMVPIYGITSWLSLVLPEWAWVFGTIRDFYEAYAIYTFIALLIAIVEDGKGMSVLIANLTQRLIDEQSAIIPPWPCCYDTSRPSHVASVWLYQCKLMAMQFVLLKPFIAAPNNPWGDGLDWRSAKLYVLILGNISVATAFYGLLTFYYGLEKDLLWCNPWPKFLCIKGVVFMTFWQGLAIQFMASTCVCVCTGVIGDKQAIQLQNLLTCVEMLLASLAHFYIFPYYEWAEGYKRDVEKSVLIRDTLALRDFVTDMKQMLLSEGSTGGDASTAGAASTHASTHAAGGTGYYDYGSHGDGEDDTEGRGARMLGRSYDAATDISAITGSPFHSTASIGGNNTGNTSNIGIGDDEGDDDCGISLRSISSPTPPLNNEQNQLIEHAQLFGNLLSPQSRSRPQSAQREREVAQGSDRNTHVTSLGSSVVHSSKDNFRDFDTGDTSDLNRIGDSGGSPIPPPSQLRPATTGDGSTSFRNASPRSGAPHSGGGADAGSKATPNEVIYANSKSPGTSAAGTGTGTGTGARTGTGTGDSTVDDYMLSSFLSVLLPSPSSPTPSPTHADGGAGASAGGELTWNDVTSAALVASRLGGVSLSRNSSRGTITPLSHTRTSADKPSFSPSFRSPNGSISRSGNSGDSGGSTNKIGSSPNSSAMTASDSAHVAITTPDTSISIGLGLTPMPAHYYNTTNTSSTSSTASVGAWRDSELHSEASLLPSHSHNSSPAISTGAGAGAGAGPGSSGKQTHMTRAMEALDRNLLEIHKWSGQQEAGKEEEEEEEEEEGGGGEGGGGGSFQAYSSDGEQESSIFSESPSI